jgi:hypothetical protein
VPDSHRLIDDRAASLVGGADDYRAVADFGRWSDTPHNDRVLADFHWLEVCHENDAPHASADNGNAAPVSGTHIHQLRDRRHVLKQNWKIDHKITLSLQYAFEQLSGRSGTYNSGAEARNHSPLRQGGPPMERAALPLQTAILNRMCGRIFGLSFE